MRAGEIVRRTSAVLRVAAHVAVAGLVLEVAARVDDRLAYGAPLAGEYGPELLREVDPAGVPRNVPGARFEKWRINGLGFRGEETPREKPPGTLRIVCLGQSESFGLYESEDGEWPARLRALLAGRRVEVVNASVVGLGRGVRRPYLDAYVLPLRPDVVVLFANVLADMSAPRARAAAPAASPSAWPRSRLVAKLKLKVLSALPRDAWARVRAWRLDRELRRLQSAPDGHPPADVVPSENVAAFEDHLRDLVRTLRSYGATPVLVTYPVLPDERNRAAFHVQIADELVWHPEWSELGLLDGHRKLNEAVSRVGKEWRVPVVDLAAAMPRTLEYFADAVHYTDRGAALVAERVMAALEGAGLLGSGPPLRPVPAAVPPGAGAP
jgi:hypothetical protein